MHKSVIFVFFSFLALLSVFVPSFVLAQYAMPPDVNIKNFPEIQQVKGDVHVINFPEVQHVKGSVSVEGMTKYISRESILVPTSQRGDLAEMVYAGTIETEGFTSILISLQGEMRNDVFSSGTIGVVLVPDEKPILRVLRDTKRIQFPIECKVLAKSGDPVYLESEQVQQRIAFSRYKIFLYNAANKSVEANVYLYLSNSPTMNVRATSVN